MPFKIRPSAYGGNPFGSPFPEPRGKVRNLVFPFAGNERALMEGLVGGVAALKEQDLKGSLDSGIARKALALQVGSRLVQLALA